MKRILGLFLASSVVTQVRGFVPSLATVSCNAVPRIRQNPTKTQNRVRSLPLDRPGRDLGRPTSALAAGGPADGSDRGNVILGLVFLICVWIFSIPPELRRTHICTSDVCVEYRSSCYDCVTFGEWTQSVKDYYRNGGGISFDFSIAQETKDLWSGKIQ